MSKACPLCKNKLNKIYLKKSIINKNSVNIARCIKCKHYYQESYSTEFEEEYYTYYKNLLTKNKEEIFTIQNKLNYKKILKIFNRHISVHNLTNKLLDVGSGHGELVNFANENKWDAIGIDLSKEAIEVGKKFNVNVHFMDINDPFFNNKKYSIIVLTEVIEHVDNPHKLIDNISKLLEINGIIYITTPNFNSLDRYLMSSDWHVIHKEHINYFTTRSLKKMFIKHGCFKINYIKSNNLTLNFIKLKFLSFFLTINKIESPQKTNEILRIKINKNFFLALIKNLINFFLSLFKLGNNITLIVKKFR